MAEIKKQIEDLTAELLLNESEKNVLYKHYFVIQNNIQLNESKHKELTKKINHHQDVINYQNMFLSISPEILQLFLEDELIEITKGMDKIDYTKFGDYPRWIDLDKIIQQAVEVKQKYPEWKLTKVNKVGHIDSLPPKTFYEYSYETPEKYNITL